jgi:hypothetical protein
MLIVSKLAKGVNCRHRCGSDRGVRERSSFTRTDARDASCPMPGDPEPCLSNNTGGGLPRSEGGNTCGDECALSEADAVIEHPHTSHKTQR